MGLFWGNKADDDQTRASIPQPPPTPGLASWAFNSLFNRQTPSSKYANLQQQQERRQLQTPRYHNTPRRRIPSHFNDDTMLTMSGDRKRNVAWGGEDFKMRSRSSSVSESQRKPTLKRFVDDNGSIHRNVGDFYREMELLPDENDDTAYSRKRYDRTPKRNDIHGRKLDLLNTVRENNNKSKNSNTTLDYLQNEKIGKSSLPQTYPGKYPSPYVSSNHKRDSSIDDDVLLSSSAVKNLAQAKSNTKLNEFLRNQKTKEDSTIQNSIPRRGFKRSVTRSQSPPQSLQRPNSRNLKSQKEIRREEQLLLDSVDQNIMELENITNHINGLKLNKYDDDKNLKYKYQEIRQELINELKKSKKLYDSYYQFVEKYRDLKKIYNSRDPKADDSMIKSLKSDIKYLQSQNESLNEKLKSKDSRYLENDYTISDLKKELQNSSNFEITLRRKIKYLEEKIKTDELNFKNERFQLNEKIFLLEMSKKDDLEIYQSNLAKANDRIKELERKLELRSAINPKYLGQTRNENLSIIPEYTNTFKNQASNKENDLYDNNDDTINLLQRRYPDRKTHIKPSPEKRYSTGNLKYSKRPFSSYSPVPDGHSDDDLFKGFGKYDKLDESTREILSRRSTTNGENDARSNSLKSGTRPNLKYSSTTGAGGNKRYSNPITPDLTLNSSEIFK